MNISTLFILRPIATFLLMLSLLVGGVTAYFMLPVAAMPEIEFPTIVVTANLPGADPETMAASVAQPLERQFAALPGVNQISSTSILGFTQVTLQFDLSRQIDGAASDVQAAINAAQGNLPKDLPTPPTYRKVNPADSPVIILGLTSEALPLETVDQYADLNIAQQIATMSGVGQVLIFGQQTFAPTIKVNPTALAWRGIGLDAVASARLEQHRAAAGRRIAGKRARASDRHQWAAIQSKRHRPRHRRLSKRRAGAAQSGRERGGRSSRSVAGWLGEAQAG